MSDQLYFRIGKVNRNGKKLRQWLKQNRRQKKEKQDWYRDQLPREDKLTREIHSSKEYRQLSDQVGMPILNECQCYDCFLSHVCSSTNPRNPIVTPKTCKRAKKEIASRLLQRRMQK